jgi:hypothetical protein
LPRRSASLPTPVTATPADARQALERFVVDNAELVELEARLGRFNVFDALRVARQEIRHSNFLAWLLSPEESHGQGDLFLRAVLMDLLRRTPPGRREISPIEIDSTRFAGVEVRREWNHIDLLIACREPALVLAVENKVYSGERVGQLARYRDVVAREFRAVPPGRRLHVYLTRRGQAASHEDWISYGYGDLHAALDRCFRLHGSGIGTDVAVFIRHYLNVIGGRFMDDPELDRLCRTIYQKHRLALDLLFDRGRLSGGPLAAARQAIESHPARFVVLGQTGRSIRFQPSAWAEVLPPIGRRVKSLGRRGWLYCEVYRTRRSLLFFVRGGHTDKDERAVREKVLLRITQNPAEFGLRLKTRESLKKRWNSLIKQPIERWRDAEPDDDFLRRRVTEVLNEQAEKLKRVGDAIASLKV